MTLKEKTDYVTQYWNTEERSEDELEGGGEGFDDRVQLLEEEAGGDTEHGVVDDQHDHEALKHRGQGAGRERAHYLPLIIVHVNKINYIITVCPLCLDHNPAYMMNIW